MATITVDTYLDDGTARTAGEAWTCNGGRLTIRTDSRWHAGSPAAMAGSLASLTISNTLGGGYTIDGTNVRWMAYDTGTGNVPAIGTAVGGGTSGASGYLLGVWASIVAAPTAVGAAMPATGFLKFREVTGAFQAAEALTNIGANATSADVVGWIEVVHDQAALITVPRLGDFTTRGDWFDLGVTTGAANQLVQLPTNGSTTTYVPGVWIANTGTPTTDEDYDFYPSLFAAGMTTTNLGTDERSKFVCMETDGQVRIGHNGTGAVGYVPAAGRAIRVPNIFGRQCTTAARATNAIPHATATTRPEFLTTGAGYIDIEHFLVDWYCYFAQAYYLKLHHVGLFDYTPISEIATAFDIYDGGKGTSQSLASYGIAFTSCAAGGTIEKWNSTRYSATSAIYSFYAIYCSGITITNCVAGQIEYARAATGYSFMFSQCDNFTISNLKSLNQCYFFTVFTNSTVTNIDYCDRFVGATNTTTPLWMLSFNTLSDNVTVDGMTFGLNGTIADVHPYAGIVNPNTSSNLTFRNAGTKAAPLSGGSANFSAYNSNSSGNNTNLRFQRMYLVPTRAAAFTSLNSDKGTIFQNVYGDFADVIANPTDVNGKYKGIGGTMATTGQTSVYGTHFWDTFTSDTVGLLGVFMNEPTAETTSLVTVVAGTPKFDSVGGLTMKTLNDEIIIEQDYFALGHATLANIAPTVSGTNVTYVSGPDWGNHDIYYQIDVNDGTGWNGAWKDLTAANLSGETISPSLGFKLKFRIVCDLASTTNRITFIKVATTSTAADQENNLYPLDEYTLTLTGLETGTKVAFTATGTETLLDPVSTAVAGSATYTFPDTDVGDVIDISVLVAGYQYQTVSYTLTAADASLEITQVADLAYDALKTATVTFDGATKRIICDAATTSIDVIGVYTEWVDWAYTGENLQYFQAFSEVGGNVIDAGAGTSIPIYTFLQNTWQIAPDEVSHTLSVTGGIILVDGGGDPFVDTAGAYTVRINYQQPVQAITVASDTAGMSVGQFLALK